jgi:hypothetical protein
MQPREISSRGRARYIAKENRYFWRDENSMASNIEE